MSEVMTNIKTRRSIRKYKPEMVPKDVIEQVMEAGIYAANGMGKQASIVVAVTNRAIRDKLSKDNCKIGGWREDFDPFYGAPVVLIVLAVKDWRNRVYDGSCVIENMMLAAHDLGIGSCWIHRAKEEFDSEEGKQILAALGIQGDYEGIGHCILGYEQQPAAPAAPRKAGRVFRIR